MNAVVELPSMQIMTVSAMTDRINAIQEVTRKKMINEVHYGIIPGTQKPTLYKAGSEMLLTMFNIGPTIRVEDLSTPAGIKYRVIVTGVHTPSGTPIGEGVGECSSNEEKYRWRNAVCQAEFDATPEEQRRIKWGRGRGGGMVTLTAWWSKLSAREQKDMSGDFTGLRKAARAADEGAR
jgi:hypothetical protein